MLRRCASSGSRPRPAARLSSTCSGLPVPGMAQVTAECDAIQDRKSTRLNSSHTVISYAVFCLKKKNETEIQNATNAHRDHIAHKGHHIVLLQLPDTAPH